ncbi:MAG: serine hydrolase domain-containing protein [Chitinophagaceae bacterium]
MKDVLILASFFILSFSDSVAQNSVKSTGVIKEALPESAGVSSERLKRIDQVIQQYIDSNWVNGAVVIFLRNGSLIYHKALGQDDISQKVPLKKDAIFRIASQTKAITSLAAMILYEEGKFLLDDPVSKYLPEYKSLRVLEKFNETDSGYTTVPAKRQITIRDLLTHTSGIDYPSIGSKAMRAIYAKADVPSGIGILNRLLATEMKKLAALPLAHQPGEKFTYGLNTDLLGYLVEIWSGTSLDKFLEQRIFEPLGMKDTYFNIPKEKQHRLATLYTEDSLHHLQKSPERQRGLYADYPNRNSTYFSGGAGLSSTAYDYAIFLQMMLNGGRYNGIQIISRATARMMTMNQVGDLNMGTNKFGLGFEINTLKGSAQFPMSEGSFSWGGYFSTTYWADPTEKIVGQIMTQVTPNSHGELANKFKVLIYQSLIN